MHDVVLVTLFTKTLGFAPINVEGGVVAWIMQLISHAIYNAKIDEHEHYNCSNIYIDAS
jgi:hypothetical protein